MFFIWVTPEYYIMADVVEVAVGEFLFLLRYCHIMHVRRVISRALTVVAVAVDRLYEHLYF